jgi:hypothetical protein
MFKLYSLHKNGESIQLQPGPHYSEYVADHERQLKNDGNILEWKTVNFTEKLYIGERLWQYWKTYLGGGIPYLNFNFAQKKQIDLSNHVGRSHFFDLGPELKSQIDTVAKLIGVTAFHVLMAGFMILLSKYTSLSDILG